MAIAIYYGMNANTNKQGENKMKKLTADDLALLASRGKVTNGFHTSTDFDIPSYDKPKKAKKAKANADHPLVGRMLHTSWGYNMTINNFAKIIEVSPSGKTVVCRMLTKEGFNGFAGEVKAGQKMIGPKFRLKVKDQYFNGSYPYIIKQPDNYGFVTKESGSTRMGYFGLYNGGKVYENHMD